MTGRITASEFYRLWLKTAGRQAWGAADTVSTATGICLAFAVWLSKTSDRTSTELTWLIPAMIGAAVFVYRLVEAPFRIFQAQETQLADAEGAARTAKASLEESRNLQLIADVLTEYYRVAPQDYSDDDRPWHDELIAKMREIGCTEQEIVHLDRITHSEISQALGANPPSPYNSWTAKKGIQLGRLAALARDYQERAAPVRAPRK